jgi:hypothetical protein
VRSFSLFDHYVLDYSHEEPSSHDLNLVEFPLFADTTLIPTFSSRAERYAYPFAGLEFAVNASGSVMERSKELAVFRRLMTRSRHE